MTFVSAVIGLAIVKRAFTVPSPILTSTSFERASDRQGVFTPIQLRDTPRDDGQTFEGEPDLIVPDIERPMPDLPPGWDGDEGDGGDSSESLGQKSNAGQAQGAGTYQALPPMAERQARLEDLFARLKADSDEEKAELIAEEIWAIWLDSGSPSVNMLLRRGTAAEKRRDIALARRMYDHVTSLSPDFAEGWARSARLAYSEDDLSRCVSEVMQALVLEPRHFYALWTLGNALERLGRDEEALKAYEEAHRLYPALDAVNRQIEKLRGRVEGDVL